MLNQPGHDDDVRPGSERGFGLVFAGVFALIGLWPLTHVFHGTPVYVRWWALGLAVVFGLLARYRPQWLKPLNRLWFRFGLLLHKVISPLVMGLVFFTAVTPLGWLRRRFHPDPLGRHPDPSKSSYWVMREGDDVLDPERLREQF